jgi:hypothetical protein
LFIEKAAILRGIAAFLFDVETFRGFKKFGKR